MVHINSMTPPQSKRANQVLVGDVLDVPGGPFEVHSVSELPGGGSQVFRNATGTSALQMYSLRKVDVIGTFEVIA